MVFVVETLIEDFSVFLCLFCFIFTNCCYIYIYLFIFIYIYLYLFIFYIYIYTFIYTFVKKWSIFYTCSSLGSGYFK